MNTKFIGIKEFRQNIANYAKQARTANTRFVVVNRNKPLFEITPFTEEESLDSLFAALQAGRKDVAAGRVYSETDILTELE